MYRTTTILIAFVIALSGCASTQLRSGEVMTIVKLRTSLDDKELLKKAHEREPSFASNPAIIQKYYIKLKEPGYYGGVYIWESYEALKKFKSSELAKSIPKAYKATEKPSVEVFDIMFQLRN